MLASLACADEVSKEKVLSELIEVMQYDKMGDQMGEVTANQLISQLKTRNPDMDAETESELRELAQNYISDLMVELEPMVAEFLTKHFTEDELREILAFQKSPVGQKSREKMPEMMQETMTWVQQQTMTSVPGLTEKMKTLMDEMKAKSDQ